MQNVVGHVIVLPQPEILIYLFVNQLRYILQGVVIRTELHLGDLIQLVVERFAQLHVHPSLVGENPFGDAFEILLRRLDVTLVLPGQHQFPRLHLVAGLIFV